MANREDDLVYVYDFFSEGGKWLHCGQTIDPERREEQHRRKWGEPRGTLQILAGPMPRWQARMWERDRKCSPFGKGPYSSPEPAVPAGDSWIVPVLALGGVIVAGAVTAWCISRPVAR